MGSAKYLFLFENSFKTKLLIIFPNFFFYLKVQSAERKFAQEIFFFFIFRSDAWDMNSSFTSKKPTHYLLDHGDFILTYYMVRQIKRLKKTTEYFLKFFFLVESTTHTAIARLCYSSSFLTEIFKPQLPYSNAPRLHTRLTELH